MNMLKVAEVAKMLKISESKAYRMVKKGVMPHVIIDGCIRIPEQALMNMLYSQIKGYEIFAAGERDKDASSRKVQCSCGGGQ